MSTTGNPDLPPARPEAMAMLTTRPPADDFEALVAHSVKSQQIVGSPAYPPDPAILKANVIADLNRSTYPVGFTRQLAAIMASGDRRTALGTVVAPTVVLHGLDDPLVPVEGGRDTAAVIPDAELREISGMGHDLPQQLFPAFVDAVETAAKKSRVPA
jgi:pimeloyl-ACP methyl ester carboxylesterase